MRIFTEGSGEIADLLEHRSINICSVQETRYSGKFVRMMGKLDWIGNDENFRLEGIMLSKKWIDIVIDISKVSDRMIGIRGLVQGIFFQSSLSLFLKV